MIPRENLINLLNGLSAEQIVYICAPAGYGKTVTVNQWLEQTGCRSAVMMLDEQDNNPGRFCTRFCAALRSCVPENGEFQRIAGHPAFDSAPEEFALRTLDTLYDDANVCLVMDDLHFVHNERTLKLLLVFLKRLPKSFQIVLVSRSEMPPGFSELWIKGKLVRITEGDLRFSRAEVELLYEIHGCPINSVQAEEIRRFTEGWAIGVGAVLMSGKEPSGDSLEYLSEFIRDNVWRRWDEATRVFMLKTAVVRELDPRLCAALTGESDSERLLDRLLRQNMFISRSKQGVYRYHRLFYNFLCQELSQSPDAFLYNLLEKAGYWYLEQKDFYNAVEYFVQCENHKGIIKCFVFLAVIDRNSFIVDKLLPILNLPIIRTVAEKFPFIYCVLAWAAFNEGRAADMADYADRYYKRQFADLRYDPRLAFYIIFTRLVDFRVSIHELMRLIHKIPRPIMSATLNAAKPSIGIINQYMPFLHRGTRDFSECAIPDAEANVAGLLQALRGLFGEESALLAECMTAGLLYEQGHLNRAYSHALAAYSEIRNHFAAETKFCAMSVLVSVLDALEMREQADRVIEHIADMIAQEGAYYLNYNFNALAVRRRLGNGDMDAAHAWLTENKTPLQEEPNFYGMYGHMTTCRAYITKGEYDTAAILLKKLSKLAKAYNRPLDIMETQILLSITYWKKKHKFQTEAILYLEQAVLTAYEYGYSQAFVNESTELSGMLRRLQRRSEQHLGANVPVSFVKMLYLKTQEHQMGGLTSGQTESPIKFTDRQKEVMKLLYDGKSYWETAEALGITKPTLRSHIAAIYKKLGVTNESDAIKKMKALGIFAADE